MPLTEDLGLFLTAAFAGRHVWEARCLRPVLPGNVSMQV